MKPLHERMREAADTLEEVSQLYEAFNPATYGRKRDQLLWTATELRLEATYVEES